MRQAAAWRCSRRASPTRTGLQARRTAGSCAALRLISGPMPAGSPTAMAILVLSPMRGYPPLYIGCATRMREGISLPWHEGCMDHVRHALATHRLDGEIHVFEPEPMRRDLLQRKPLGGKLLECKLAGLEAVAARAFDGDELHRDLFQRKVRELLHFSLDHDRPAFALERFHAEQNRDGPSAGCAIERHVHALAAGDFHEARERILLLDVDDEVGAQLSRDLHAGAVFRCTGNDNERGAGLLADHGLREPLLARALNEDARIIADAAVEQGPFHPVRHRGHQSRQFRRDTLWHMVHDRVPGKINVMGKATPQMRGLLRRRVAIADRVRVAAPVGVFAVPILAEVAPFAFAARHIVLHEYQVAFLETLAASEFAARF